MTDTTYTKYAFISYSHRDMAVAKWLHRKLEGFRLPSDIHNDIEVKNRYLRPVFRDQSDLNAGILSDELRHQLEESKFLIILCSKDSAKSMWVSAEAQTFVEMGRLDRIIPVIIPDGATPERELFPEYLRNYFRQYPDQELLGVNIGEVGKEKALIRIVSKMLGVSFDSLWKRHLRQKRQRIAIASAISIVALAMAYLFAVPVSVSVDVSLQKADLPVGEDVTIIVDGGEYSASVSDSDFPPISIPGYKRFSDISVTTSSLFFTTLDTVIPVGFGTKRIIHLDLKRDDTFAVYAGIVYDDDMAPLQEATVSVSGHDTVTDAEGRFSIILPLAEQREELPISLHCRGYRTVFREDEIPGTSLSFIMHRNS